MIKKESIFRALCDTDYGVQEIAGKAIPIMPNTLRALEIINSLPEEGYDMNAFQEEVLRYTPVQNYSGEHDMLLNGVMGMCGEAGECMDYLKKVLYQNEPMNREKLAEEIGDVLNYVALAAQGLGYSLQDIAIQNNVKLHKRYPNGFDPDRFVNREKYEGAEKDD